MEATNAAKKPPITPKAMIHLKFSPDACYKIEEVPQLVNSGVPGLINPQKSINLYRCCLTLPELTVTSDAFTKKKDAEQAAAKLAIEKLGIQFQSTVNELTLPEAWNELVARIPILFSDEFLLSPHPLTVHFKVNMKKTGNMFGTIPLSAIASCDVKANNLCKIVDPKAESDPIRVASLIWKAAKMSNSVCVANDGEFRITKLGEYSCEPSEVLTNCTSGLIDDTRIKAIFIPYTGDGNIKSLSLEISNNCYYMDEIAQKLNASDASQLLVSRAVDKASSEMKLYFCVPKAVLVPSNSSTDILLNDDGDANLKKLLNIRASYLSGQNIYGDAILANVGYKWKSSDIFYDDVPLCRYYRMMLGKVPDGHYILSREAIIAADLPTTFTSRSNWRGPLPRDLLCTFCRKHRLSEPIFAVKTINPSENHMSENCKRIKLLDEDLPTATKKDSDKPRTYKCDVKILSKNKDLLLECMPDSMYKKESDAIQNVALKVIAWLNKYFAQLSMPIDEIASFGPVHNIRVQLINFCREFEMLVSLHGAKQNLNFRKSMSLPYVKEENSPMLVNVEGDDSGVLPSPGSLTCISYSVVLKREDGHMKEEIEKNDEFEFEIGTGAVVNYMESCVTQLSVNQSAQFVSELPSRDLLLAAAGEFAENLANQSLSNCFLEYSIKVLRVTEPMENRMEQALFSPPLSKQRVEFAVRHINDSHSTTLVDFGCGSGSLLDSLLEHSTTLERIIGVDISIKALTHAAKIIHSKLSKNSALQESIKSVVLYDGSIMNFDSRLYGVDIGTCLEVIEHMEEDQACLFGDIVLSSFCPKILIVSTPNYEYNPILQKSNKEVADPEEEKSGACKFRNNDHKFEWTRKQFEQWANDLAIRHNYHVEFSGVGGDGNVEPGFASQIAVFTSKFDLVEGKFSTTEETLNPYKVLWEWNGVRN